MIQMKCKVALRNYSSKQLLLQKFRKFLRVVGHCVNIRRACIMERLESRKRESAELESQFPCKGPTVWGGTAR